jgi:hypothetical protein
MIHQLNPPLAVIVTAKTFPKGCKTKGGSAWCYAWIEPGGDAHTLWKCCMDDTGEWIDVPQPEVLGDLNWSMGRR